jgi:hypothetical protein
MIRLASLVLVSAGLDGYVVLPPIFAKQMAKAHRYTISSEVPIKLLRHGYSLDWGHSLDSPLGLPVTYDLCLAGPRSFTSVRDLNDLRGSVKVSSSRDDLRFVRLRTSPTTCLTFGTNSDVWCEIVDVSSLGPDSCLGLVRCQEL